MSTAPQHTPQDTAPQDPVSQDPAPQPQAQAAPDPDEGRRRHYGLFYGLDPLPESELPRLVVFGNCMAEALRICLSSVDPADVDSVRIPPVHELTETDLPHLHRLLATTDILVAQPVRDDYRGMALGTDQIRRKLAEGARVVLVPSVQDNTAQPYQVLVHGDGIVDPPLSPYHDLRTVAEAASLGGGPWSMGPLELIDAWRQISKQSIDSLEQRAAKQHTISVTDVVAANPGQFWTMNHPDNPVILTIARRVREQLEMSQDVVDPGRALLGSLRAPVDADVVEALELDRQPTTEFTIDGKSVPIDDVRQAHLQYYRDNPKAVELALSLHADKFKLFGWGS